MKGGESATAPERRSRWLGVVDLVLRVPADIVVVVSVGLAATLLVTAQAPVPLRLLVALPLVFFLPGYVLLAVLFPAGSPIAESDVGPRWPRMRGARLAWTDRLALSFASSLVLVPILGLFLAVFDYGFAPATVVTALAVSVVVGGVAGAVRRMQLPEEAQFHVPVRAVAGASHEALFGTGSRLEAGLNVLVALLAVTAVVALGFGLVAPQSAEQYSEFYLLTQDSGGEATAAGFPSVVTAGSPVELVVGVENYEQTTTSYTVVTELQRVDGADGTVVSSERLDRFEVTLAPGEQVREVRTVTPQSTGEDLRLTYYLYKGAGVGDRADAYRTTFIWLTVEE